jgi:uncharacterized protein (DUF4213/DUF364 family)
MTIDSILTEWSYRLPKGYPTQSRDYKMLYDIILEMTDLSPLEAQHVVNRAQGITEATELIDIKSMYSNRVFRIETSNSITIYSEQPFDDHDFDINDAAQNEIQSVSITTNQFLQQLNLKSKYNVYKFNLSFQLEKTYVINGINISKTLNTSDLFNDAASFEQYIKTKFSVEGQQIIGLPAMYDAVMSSDETDQLIDLITGPVKMRLATGVVPIRGVYSTLYNIIKNTIKIPNGDESELWFAISYGGLVKGAVAGESGIEADIEVGNQTVSLKNYEKITFDFGSLSSEGVQLLNSFLEMAKLLTGQDISKSKGREQINSVLDFLDTEKTETDIRRIIKLGDESDIPMLQNISKKLQSFYQLDDNLDTMIHAFCNIVDKMVVEKITSVNWWGMIIKSNETLFLEAADELAPILKCRNDRLSPAIANFHQNKLFVLGSQLNTKVTKKPQD